MRTRCVGLLFLLLAGMVLVTACSSSDDPTSDAKATAPPPTSATAVVVPPAATPVVPPTAPAADDDAVWGFVAGWVKGQVDLVLRPDDIPAGLDTAAVEIATAKEDHGIYQVSYSGPAGKVWLGAGYINPPPGTPGTETMVDVRGNDAHLYQTAEGQTWLYWHENGVSPATFLYFVRGTISPEDVMKIAGSLVPYP